MNNKELFEKINEILLKSLKPSEDLERLIIEGYLDKEPFNKIKKLNNIEQNPKYHPEGSVLKHVLLVVDLASEYKKYSNDEKVFMWAALLHDIGKLTTTRVRKNRITSYNHDTEGKDIAMNILNELTDDEEFKQKVSKLVRWHMQPLFYDKNLPFFVPATWMLLLPLLKFYPDPVFFPKFLPVFQSVPADLSFLPVSPVPDAGSR